MSKIILDDVVSGYNLQKINANFQLVESELNNKVLYRQNPVGENNQLESDIDANGKKIFNLASPSSRSEPITLGYLEDRIGGVIEVSSWESQQFIGDGVSSSFILNVEPVSLESVFVSVDGSTYIPNVDFTLISSVNLQFNTPPYNGANIDVRYGTFTGASTGLEQISNRPQEAGDNGLVANNTEGTIKNLKAGTNISLTSEANRIVISGTGGAANITASNKGIGSGVFDAKVGDDLQFKSLIAGGNVTLSESADSITISTPAFSGEANTASNKGIGTGLFASKVGLDLQFKSLVPAGTVQISSPDASTVTIDCTARTTLATSTTGTGGVDVLRDRVVDTLRFKPLVAGSGVTITNSGGNDFITISATGGSSLPSQTGNAGKVLKTDGALLSWTGGFVPLDVNTTVKNHGTDRINISNTGSYGTTTDLISSGDAHRFHKKVNWNAVGNDATFHVETEINAVGPNYGPIHGGVWSSLTATGGPSPIFALMGSAHRKHTGPSYGIHGEVWDRNGTPGLCCVFNAETAQTPSLTVAGSTYIGYNFGLGATATDAIGLQIQSVGGAVSNNYLAGVKFDAFQGISGIEFGSGSSNTNFLKMFSANAMWNGGALGAYVGKIRISIDGLSYYIPVYN